MLVLAIYNDGSGDDRVANYDVELRVNRDVIRRVRVEGFERSFGAEALVKVIADALVQAKERFRMRGKNRRVLVMFDLGIRDVFSYVRFGRVIETRVFVCFRDYGEVLFVRAKSGNWIPFYGLREPFDHACVRMDR